VLGQFTLNQLKEEISEVEFERYIKKLKYDEKASRNDLAVYEAPNMFVANWVKTKYSSRLSHLFELKTGMKPRIEIIVKDTKETIQTIDSEKSKKTNKTVILNPSYTFDSFVKGNSNQFAFTVSKNVSSKPGVLYNPLLIYGGTGLGKTHLLNAIGNENLKKGKTIIYVTSEQFLNDFMLHVNNQTMDRFRDKYRECDFLLIDDVQFFSNKNAVQEEFFHTFNELHGKNKQIVLTSDKHPKQIAGLEDRLKSRFEWGLVADIQPPELETKIAIIKKKCELDRVYLNNDIIDYIATNMDNNIREIEGIIIKLNAYSSLMNQEITLDFAKSILKEQIKEKRENITLDSIIRIVSRELNIKPSEIKSKSRSTQIANARRIVIYLARNLTPNSMPSLAKFFGMRDHSSVSKAMKKVQETVESDADFRNIIEELKNKITTQNQNS